MALFTERQRRRRQAEREAAGEVLWGEMISTPARVMIAQIWADAAGTIDASTFERDTIQKLAALITASVRRSTGTNPVCIYPQHLAESKAGTPDLLDLFEALYESIAHLDNSSYRRLASAYESRLNDVLNAHRVAFKMINGEMVPFSGDPVYAATIEPTIRLLIDRRFDGAQAAFLKALREIQDGEADDAITDAGTALQETLTALGCQGDVLGRLIQDARARGLLAGHDEKLTAGISSFLNWASADRSQTGDAHKQSDATIADAWLAVHIIGALIIRLPPMTPACRRRPSVANPLIYKSRRGANMNEPTSAPESGRPVEDRGELIEGSRSIEWIVPVQPIIFDPYVPGGSDLPLSTSSGNDSASSPDSGQGDAQPTTQPETNP